MHVHIPSDGGKPEKIVENPAGKVSIPALATTAYTAKQPKKGRRTFRRESLKEILTINAIKHMSISAKRFRDGESFTTASASCWIPSLPFFSRTSKLLTSYPCNI